MKLSIKPKKTSIKIEQTDQYYAIVLPQEYLNSKFWFEIIFTSLVCALAIYSLERESFWNSVVLIIFFYQLLKCCGKAFLQIGFEIDGVLIRRLVKFCGLPIKRDFYALTSLADFKLIPLNESEDDEHCFKLGFIFLDETTWTFGEYLDLTELTWVLHRTQSYLKANECGPQLANAKPNQRASNIGT